MKHGAVGAGAVAWAGAVLSSLCCLLPLAVIALGVGSGAFMAVTMQYRWILIPAGVAGVAAGFALYARERRRCSALACRMAGLPGVSRAEVSFREKEARVTFDPAQVGVGQLVEAVNRIGFRASVKRSSE